MSNAQNIHMINQAINQQKIGELALNFTLMASYTYRIKNKSNGITFNEQINQHSLLDVLSIWHFVYTQTSFESTWTGKEEKWKSNKKTEKNYKFSGKKFIKFFHFSSKTMALINGLYVVQGEANAVLALLRKFRRQQTRQHLPLLDEHNPLLRNFSDLRDVLNKVWKWLFKEFSNFRFTTLARSNSTHSWAHFSNVSNRRQRMAQSRHKRWPPLRSSSTMGCFHRTSLLFPHLSKSLGFLAFELGAPSSRLPMLSPRQNLWPTQRARTLMTVCSSKFFRFFLFLQKKINKKRRSILLQKIFAYFSTITPHGIKSVIKFGIIRQLLRCPIICIKFFNNIDFWSIYGQKTNLPWLIKQFDHNLVENQ